MAHNLTKSNRVDQGWIVTVRVNDTDFGTFYSAVFTREGYNAAMIYGVQPTDLARNGVGFAKVDGSYYLIPSKLRALRAEFAEFLTYPDALDPRFGFALPTWQVDALEAKEAGIDPSQAHRYLW